MSADETKRNNAKASQRKLPPHETRFKKGQSGNPAGRPQGAVSLARITRKVALQKVAVTIRGKRQLLTRLDVAVLKLKMLAADGTAAAAEELSKLRARFTPDVADRKIGYLVVPEIVSLEDYMAEVQERNKDKPEPGTAIDLDAEEFIKAVRGEKTVYGEALLAHHRKYRDLDE